MSERHGRKRHSPEQIIATRAPGNMGLRLTWHHWLRLVRYDESAVARIFRITLGAVVLGAMGCAQGPAAGGPREIPTGQAASERHVSAPAADAEPKIVHLPGVTVNMTDRYVELTGQVCLQEGLLELVATVPAGKEHESIVSLKTRPSNIHAALLMLGLEPGEPGRWRYEEDRVVAIDPRGDRVGITLLWERQGGWVEEPIEKFILDRTGKKHLPGSEFVFAGSRMYQPTDAEGNPAGEPVYLADQTGDIIALVSFDSELLAWPTAASDSNEELFWTADPRSIPPLGTPVKLRIYPATKGSGFRVKGSQRPAGSVSQPGAAPAEPSTPKRNQNP